MKKAKLMITGLAIVAVVGSSLAFTAMKSSRQIFCQSSVNGQCTIAVNGRQTTDNLTDPLVNPCNVSGATNPATFGTASTTANCAILTSTVPVYATTD